MPRIDLVKLKYATLGRWSEILRAAGVEAHFLTRRHGPCPICGGKDRFRFTDRDGRGCFICNGCSPDGGDGLRLLAGWLNLSFIDTCRWVHRYLGGGMAEAAPSRAPDPALKAAEAAALATRQRHIHDRNRALWRAAAPITAGSVADSYLRQRGVGLDAYPDALRFHPSVGYWQPGEGKPDLLGNYPAMLAAVQSPSGSLIALHQTFLTSEGRKAAVPSPKKWTSTSGEARGAAVRLYRQADRVRS